MNRYRQLILPLCLLGASLVAFPLTEIALGSWPFDLGTLRWRYGIEGVISGAILTPMIGLMMFIAAAAMVDSLWPPRILFGIAVVAVLAIAVLIGAFVLDALQLRNSVNAAGMGQFKRATLSGVMRDFAALFVAIGYSIATWRMGWPKSRSKGATTGREGRESTPVVVGLRETK